MTTWPDAVGSVLIFALFVLLIGIGLTKRWPWEKR